MRARILTSSNKSRSLSRNKQLSSDSFEIIPAQVIFKDIQLGQDYQITIEIRNLTNRSRRIRFQKVDHPNIKILYSMQTQIAPGLSTNAKIKYYCKELKNQNAVIKIISQDDIRKQLHVKVYKMENQIEFQPFIDMGFLKIGKIHQERIPFKNIGKTTAFIEFYHDYGNLITLQPKSLKIQPQKQVFLKIIYKPSQNGIFKGFIKLKSDTILMKNTIDIHATSFDHIRYIVDDKNNISNSFDFGSIFIGEQAVIKAFIINNSPQTMVYKSHFKKGNLVSSYQFATIQAPHELGAEQNQRIMFMQPESGVIGAFEQQQIKLICKTKVSYKEMIFVNSYALTPSDQEGAIQFKKRSKEFKADNNYEYSILIQTQQKDPLIVQLKANAICPLVKLDNNVFKFGDCIIKQSKQLELTLQNKNIALNTEINFPKILNFTIKPSSCIIKPGEIMKFIITFRPKIIGKIDTVQQIIINKIYEIDLRLFGIVRTSDSKSLRKIESVKQNMLNMNNIRQRCKTLDTIDKPMSVDKKKQTQDIQFNKIEFQKKRLNNNKYNKFLNEKRVERLNRFKDDMVQKKWSWYQNKLHDLGAGGKYQQKFDEEGNSINAPIDYEFQTGMIDTKLRKPSISIPTEKEELYVSNNIYSYKQLPTTKSNELFIKNSKEAPKKIYPEVSHNLNHQRQIQTELTYQELSNIRISATAIDFGDVNIKSKESRYFWLHNGSKKIISVIIETKDAQLSGSFKKSQIIPAGSEAAFQIVFHKQTLGLYHNQIKYKINNIHQFQLTITARSVPVEININKTNLKFEFDVNSLQMSTSKIITLHNPGNSVAKFKFIQGKEKIFIPKFLEGSLKPQQKMQVPILFIMPIPTMKKNEYNYTERILFKVIDGAQTTVICSHIAIPQKYSLKWQAFQKELVLCLGHELEEYIQLKNQSKLPMVFHIQGFGVTIKSKICLNPDESRKFKVHFKAVAQGEFPCGLSIIPRGGIKKQKQTVINVIDPHLQIKPSLLDMGMIIVHGIPGKSDFSLICRSPIELPLLIDLRPIGTQSEYLQNVKIYLKNSDQVLQLIQQKFKQDKQFKNQIAKQGENLVGLQIDYDQFESSDSEETLNAQQKVQPKRYRLQAKPFKTYNFTVQFYPKSKGKYQIIIPIFIQKIKNRIINSPTIKCESINPQFLIEPSLIDFKKKIVTRPDRCYPKFITVTISNIDDQDVNWYLQDDEIKKDGIFEISQSNGFVRAKQKIQIKVGFNPFSVGQYYHKIPFFIVSTHVQQPLKYIDLVLKGYSSYPMLYFNKRQVIMPVVPLGIQTTASFRIINDGYQNCNLRYQFIDDLVNIGVKLAFPDGINIGITKKKIKIDLSWRFNKPISFCLMLQFIDDMNRSFTLPVSGTADNCILTTYTYFLRNQHKFAIKNQNTLQLVQQLTEQVRQRKNSAQSLKSNLTSKTIFSYFGVPPISNSVLSNTIDFINRYINANFLNDSNFKFPESFIQKDGDPLFEIISYLSNKSVNFSWRVNEDIKGRPQKAIKVYQQYNELIRLLKLQGAHLNHIRPEYLLSFYDFNEYLSSLPKEKLQNYLPSLTKIGAGLYNYLSIESWIVLFYQVIKIYFLSRITTKTFKLSMPNFPEIPSYYIEGSNFLSTSETILFFWAEQAVQFVLKEERRLTNFDKDFKDSVVIGCLIERYTHIKIVQRLKLICVYQQDYKQNAGIICEVLNQIGLLNNIIAKDIYNPLQRQILLFIMNLYTYLPFYTPKQEPIIFKCVLGQQVTRGIQLNNPSNRPTTYNVKYQGSDDFKLISPDAIRIQPRQTYKYLICFVSRLSTSVNGKIMFVNVKDKGLAAAALVFQLKSQITGRVSDKIWNITGFLYEQIQFTIDVDNKFNKEDIVDFSITSQTEYIFDPLNSKNFIPPLSKDQQIPTIYSKVDNIKIKKLSQATLTLNFIPISMYSTKTTILFVNTIIGEFQHQIIATVLPPAFIAQIRPPTTLTVDQMFNWQYLINPKNQMLIKAKKSIQNAKKRKNISPIMKENKTSISDSYISQYYNVDIGNNIYLTTKETVYISDRPANQRSKESLNSYSQAIKKQSIKAEDLKLIQNKISLNIFCKNPIYEFSTFIAISNKTKTDVRRYKIIFTIFPKPLKAFLQMRAPARGEITQNLPIVNNSDRQWLIKVNWQPDTSKNGNYFAINSAYFTSFLVKKQSIGNFPVTFRPKWAYEAQAKLIMNNPLTLDSFQYHILGFGQDPLAEEHINIKCETKQLIKRQIIVKNPYMQKPITFRVQTDLPHCQYNKKLTINSGGKEKFQFYVQFMVCGEYTGSITLYEEDGPQYIWYTVSIVTNIPVALKTMNLQSQIRKKHIQNIRIPYTGSVQNAYQVVINGQGLNGFPSIILKPGVQNIYHLQFLPLQVGYQKASITFLNTQLGEILYQFNLKCNPKPVTIINNIKSPLGVSSFEFLQLTNPVNSKATIKVSNSNPQQFAVKSSIIKLNPFQSKKVQVQYIPASLQSIESAKIKFSSPQIGDWEYEFSGMGLAPVPFPPVIVYNGLFEQYSDSIKFRNPFKYDITVGVKMTYHTSADEKVFRLLNTTKIKFDIESFNYLQVPFSFIPTACKKYQCNIIIIISQKIFWTYPIKGVTQINQGKVIANLAAKCRTTSTENIQVQLQGIQNFKQHNQYSYKIQNVPHHYKHLIDKFLIVDCPKDHLNHPKDTLQFEFLYKPMKPGKVSFDFLITREEGSRWRFKVHLQGTDPEPDDFIQIQSSLLITTTVNFKMTNTQKTTAPFKAKFTSDSAHEFGVQPKEGILSKFGSKGTNFYVSFTPVEYGKQKKGKLIIQTSDMYWSYLLKGSLPKYVPPSKADTNKNKII